MHNIFTAYLIEVKYIFSLLTLVKIGISPSLKFLPNLVPLL